MKLPFHFRFLIGNILENSQHSIHFLNIDNILQQNKSQTAEMDLLAFDGQVILQNLFKIGSIHNLKDHLIDSL